MTLHFLIVTFFEAWVDNKLRLKGINPHVAPLAISTLIVWVVNVMAHTDGYSLQLLAEVGLYAFVLRGALFNFFYNGFAGRGWAYASGRWYDPRWTKILGLKPSVVFAVKLAVVAIIYYLI